MKRLSCGVAEELDGLPELGLKRGFGNNQLFLRSGPCWRFPHIDMVYGMRAYLHAIALEHAYLIPGQVMSPDHACNDKKYAAIVVSQQCCEGIRVHIFVAILKAKYHW